MWFRQQLARHRLLVSALILAEVPAALARRERQGTISKFEMIRGRHEFDQHWGKGQYTVWPVILSIVQQAAQLTYRHPLAAYDAVHLATALDYLKTSGVNPKQFYFLTADDQLQRAAQAEGLQTENPNDHP
jgi:predicted nucleic acid-binding protein